MNRKTLALGAAILLLLSLSGETARRLQSAAASSLAPIWRARALNAPEKAEAALLEARLVQLQEERDLLESLYFRQLELLRGGPPPQAERELFQLWTGLKEALPARVIYRTPAFWNSGLWIDLGKKHNRKLGKRIVQKNSPVVSGEALVGVVEEVLENQSRVRLITDSGLNPSVRAVRLVDGEKRYLAKGELQGSRQAEWRRRSHLLRGVGFNYDFADEKGPARDLRTGEPEGEGPLLPILQEGDLLVTTGMDGIFPPGLKVASVERVEMLKEGDYAYALEASPSASDLEELRLVFVLPPLIDEESRRASGVD